MAKALANQLDKLQIQDKIANMKPVEILTDILTKEADRSDVVVFGEGDFTFSTGLASLRGSWGGITSTRYEPVSDKHLQPAYSDVQLETLGYCLSNGKLFSDASDVILSKVEKVRSLESLPDHTWQFGVDATNIPGALNVIGKVAWFQCPWVQADKSSSKKTGHLIATFLNHMEEMQEFGDHTLVGIVNDKQCVQQYNLEELLGVDLRGPAHCYQFLGADKSFVRELLQYGYHYEGCVGDHSRFLNDHITLVFCRQIRIRYGYYMFAGVNHVDILGCLLCEEKSDVVVFGEGDFTFSTALASLRGSWGGITSTRYEPISDARPRPEYFDVKEETLRYCISNGKLFNDASDVILSKVEKVLSLRIPLDDRLWQFGVDATSIPQGLMVERKVVWFQCPWVIRSDRGSDTGKLVADFLKHMSSKQCPGDYALVGIVNLYDYVVDYNLPGLLGDDLAHEHACKYKFQIRYKFLGADQIFVKELLQHGYHHKGYKDCHEYFAEHHITLVFLRTE